MWTASTRGGAEVTGTQQSPRRAEVLDVLRAADGPLGVAEVAERVGVHPNTVRFHLDALVADGAVHQRVAVQLAGRPRTVYVPRPGMDRSGSRSYRLLAQVLVSLLAAAGPNAAADATAAGREWGRFLVDPMPPFRPHRRESADRLTALLKDLGFAPTAEPGAEGGAAPERIRLRHCPFLSNWPRSTARWCARSIWA